MENICDLYIDAIPYILEFLSDNEKICLFFICRFMMFFLDKVQYTNIYEYQKIFHLPFYRKFQQIKFLAVTNDIPKEITHLILDESFTGSYEKLSELTKLLHVEFDKKHYHKLFPILSPNIMIKTFDYEGKFSDYRYPGARIFIPEYIRIPLIGNNCEDSIMLEKELEEVDKIMASKEMRVRLFGKHTEIYEYTRCVKRVKSSQYGYLCPTESPAGESVGLVKNNLIFPNNNKEKQIIGSNIWKQLDIEARKYTTGSLNDYVSLENNNAIPVVKKSSKTKRREFQFQHKIIPKNNHKFHNKFGSKTKYRY